MIRQLESRDMRSFGDMLHRWNVAQEGEQCKVGGYGIMDFYLHIEEASDKYDMRWGSDGDLPSRRYISVRTVGVGCSRQDKGMHGWHGSR